MPKKLVTTLSGIVNKPGLAVYATKAGSTPLLLGDLGERADRATPRVEAITGYRGPARVAAYTVTYQGFDPATGREARVFGLGEWFNLRAHRAWLAAMQPLWRDRASTRFAALVTIAVLIGNLC